MPQTHNAAFTHHIITKASYKLHYHLSSHNIWNINHPRCHSFIVIRIFQFICQSTSLPHQGHHHFIPSLNLNFTLPLHSIDRCLHSRLSHAFMPVSYRPVHVIRLTILRRLTPALVAPHVTRPNHSIRYHSIHPSRQTNQHTTPRHRFLAIQHSIRHFLTRIELRSYTEYNILYDINPILGT